MRRVYEISVSPTGYRELDKGLQDFEKLIERKADELAKRLAEIGVQRAEANFSSVMYDGPEDHTIEIVPIEPGCYSVRASGTTVLFVEFGTGLIGWGHPEPSGMGPGTYPGKGHWKDPNGWYYAHGQHTYGNVPNMPMYNTVKELESSLEQVVSEVFGHD